MWTVRSTTPLSIWDGTILASNDDYYGLDPAVAVTATDGPFIVRVEACCGGEPNYGQSTGWYQLDVRVDGVPMLPSDGLCSTLEVGGPWDGTTGAVALEAASEVWPYEAQACLSDCGASLAGVPQRFLDAFCGDGATLSLCGDGQVGRGEQCDDGNATDGDG